MSQLGMRDFDAAFGPGQNSSQRTAKVQTTTKSGKFKCILLPSNIASIPANITVYLRKADGDTVALEVDSNSFPPLRLKYSGGDVALNQVHNTELVAQKANGTLDWDGTVRFVIEVLTVDAIGASRR